MVLRHYLKINLMTVSVNQAPGCLQRNLLLVKAILDNNAFHVMMRRRVHAHLPYRNDRQKEKQYNNAMKHNVSKNSHSKILCYHYATKHQCCPKCEVKYINSWPEHDFSQTILTFPHVASSTKFFMTAVKFPSIAGIHVNAKIVAS